MKKFLIIVAVMGGFSASAQTFQLGAKAGVNISNYTGGEIKSNSLVGFHAGAFLNLGLGKHLSIQPEAILSSQGAKLEQAGDEENFKVTYLNLPVMVKYRFDGGFFLEAGPQFGFKLDNNTPDEGLEDFAKSSDVSGVVGLGYHGASGLGIGARYIAGLTKVGDVVNGDNIDFDPDYKNSVIQVSIFFTLFNQRHKN